MVGCAPLATFALNKQNKFGAPPFEIEHSSKKTFDTGLKVELSLKIENDPIKYKRHHFKSNIAQKKCLPLFWKRNPLKKKNCA